MFWNQLALGLWESPLQSLDPWLQRGYGEELRVSGGQQCYLTGDLTGAVLIARSQGDLGSPSPQILKPQPSLRHVWFQVLGTAGDQVSYT